MARNNIYSKRTEQIKKNIYLSDTPYREMEESERREITARYRACCEGKSTYVIIKD